MFGSSAWTKTRSLHECRNFCPLILPLPSLSLFLSLSLFFSLFMTGPTSVALSCVSSRLNFAPKSIFRAKQGFRHGHGGPAVQGSSTPMKMCIQADLDNADALRHMDKSNSERPVCITHPLAPISTSFLFVFDTEWEEARNGV